MADSAGDKSENASDHKLRKSREEGQVARSRDLATAVGLVATLQVTALFMPDYLRKFHALFQRGLDDTSGPGSLNNIVGAVWADAGWLFAQMLLPCSSRRCWWPWPRWCPVAGCCRPRICNPSSAA